LSSDTSSLKKSINYLKQEMTKLQNELSITKDENTHYSKSNKSNRELLELTIVQRDKLLAETNSLTSQLISSKSLNNTLTDQLNQNTTYNQNSDKLEMKLTKLTEEISRNENLLKIKLKENEELSNRVQ